jgi:hypothetical protein
VLLAIATACGGSIEPYETRDGDATHLDGTKARPEAWSVGDALSRRPRNTVDVRGYLVAPRDDEARLCTRLAESGECLDGPWLVVDTSRVDLDAAPALEAGCCALGLWSSRAVVLRLKLQSGSRALVLG